VANELKSGRPPICINIANLVKEIITKNSTFRSFLCGYITAEVAFKLGVNVMGYTLD
jgi:hypothetical protein